MSNLQNTLQQNKRILINATQTEELRVAIVDITTQDLLDLLVERQSYKTKAGNIYMGKITAIEPSLDACFVNFGSERHGFLPFKEIAPGYFLPRTSKSDRPPAIKDSLKVGQTVMIQVEKEERGSKGAALTTFISLAGSYLVLMPNNPRAGGISRRVEGGDREELREILSHLPIPEEMGLIIRTAGVGKAITELQWDLNTLLKQWEAIQKATVDQNPPFLIHQESDILIRAIRDHLREDVSEILVDDSSIFERLKAHLEQIRPDFVHCLKLYTSSIPLFNRYQIEHQIEAAHEREVRLPSGGSIVIGHTEALVAIDVNSGQATKGKDIEQTAFEINKEAARVIACQLRLRDIGGLIVVDFIDMPSLRHRREVENEMRNALKLDKARTQVGSISQRFGLLEMSRQRLRHSLGEATRLVCPRCDGWGSIRSVESLSLSILRVIEEDAIRPGTAQIQAQLPVEVATFVINEKRDLIATIEKNQGIQIFIIPNPKLESPHYRIKRLTEGEVSGGVGKGPSYSMIDAEEPDALYKKGGTPIKTSDEKPAVKGLFTEPVTGDRVSKPVTGLVKRLISTLFGTGNVEEKTPPKTISTPSTQGRHISGKHARHTSSQKGPTPQQQHRHAHHHHKPPRMNAPGTAEKTQKPQGKMTHGKPTPEKITQPQPTRPPQKGPRGGGNIQRHPHPIAPPAPPKVEPLTPPSYLQPSLSDADLETYYQESAAFANKKPVVAPTPHKPPVQPEANIPTTTTPVAETPSSISPPPSTDVKPQPTPITIPKIEIDPKKPWVPHKVASPSSPAPAAPSSNMPAPEPAMPAVKVEKEKVTVVDQALEKQESEDK